MTCEEIFSTIINHMVKGLMVHEQFADYYDFLGLSDYSKCHEEHFFKENKMYRKMYHYYITTYNKLLPEVKFEQPGVIPSNWLKYTRQDVDIQTKQKAVQIGLEKWYKWEQDTLKLYQEMYAELIKNNSIASAEKVARLITKVQKEVCEVEQYHLNKVATGYDMVNIVEEQEFR